MIPYGQGRERRSADGAALPIETNASPRDLRIVSYQQIGIPPVQSLVRRLPIGS
jgi:hypothetical protein